MGFTQGGDPRPTSRFTSELSWGGAFSPWGRHGPRTRAVPTGCPEGGGRCFSPEEVGLALHQPDPLSAWEGAPAVGPMGCVLVTGGSARARALTVPRTVPGCKALTPDGCGVPGASGDTFLRSGVVGEARAAQGTEVRQRSPWMLSLIGLCLWKVFLNASDPQFAALENGDSTVPT